MCTSSNGGSFVSSNIAAPYVMIEAPSQSTAPRQIQEGLDRMKRDGGELRLSLTELTKRLSPVLRPEPNDGDDNCGQLPSLAPLALELHEHCNGLEQCLMLIRDLLKLLEI